VAGFRRHNVATYDEAKENMSVGYESAATELTIYVYRQTPGGTLSKVFQGSAAATASHWSTSEIIDHRQVKIETRSGTRTGEMMSLRLGLSDEQRAEMGDQAPTGPIVSSLYVLPLGNWWVKVRTSPFGAVPAKADSETEEFLRQLSWPNAE
jgi:hypothetical protein